MRFRRSTLIILLLLAVIIVSLIYVIRGTRADFGPATAICPGPDGYGYTCTGGTGFAYIDATQDTGLYADDGVIALELPFPFTFYGTTYTEINASSNGNLQFGSTNPRYGNTCLANQPVAEMGEMIAPYWDDLNLLEFGFLETETVGEEPERIFVVEWDDVPVFGDNPDDRVTFAVQLFESSNDIVFLYEDVTRFDGHNGASATIGLQSAANGLALQFSCNQAAIADAGRIYFPYPERPNPDVTPLETGTAVTTPTTQPLAKGVTADLIDALNQSGADSLPQLANQWRRQTPHRAAVWKWADVMGNGRSQLIILWYGGADQPGLAQLAILAADKTGQMSLLYNEHLSTRSEPVAKISIAASDDLTQDGLPDLLLQDDTGQLSVVTTVTGSLSRLPVPERCQGGLLVQNGQIIRDGCATAGRVIVGWNGREFAQ
ncbi:MAG: hypothetical protein H6667_18700 [Ardenticatenaceae bacterium]|nr:hypothetical protein [Ardenticatenaceae bacterium]MCB9446484.1 hypothetical protein [Ardenticatenaceae bacterium]